MIQNLFTTSLKEIRKDLVANFVRPESLADVANPAFSEKGVEKC
jgi:hypothetical protein